MPRRDQIDDRRPQRPKYDDVQDDDSSPDQPDDQEKLRSKRDYINVPSHPYLKKIMHKQGTYLLNDHFLF